MPPSHPLAAPGSRAPDRTALIFPDPPLLLYSDRVAPPRKESFPLSKIGLIIEKKKKKIPTCVICVWQNLFYETGVAQVVISQEIQSKEWNTMVKRQAG